MKTSNVGTAEKESITQVGDSVLPKAFGKTLSPTLTTIEFVAGSSLQHNFDTLILLVHEHLITLRRITQVQTVGNYKARINFSLLDSLQQGAHIVLHMALTCLHGKPLVHQ